MPCAYSKCKDAFKVEKGIPCQVCGQKFHRKCTKQTKNTKEFLCVTCSKESEIQPSECSQVSTQKASCKDCSGFDKKLKDLEAEIKSLQEIIKVKDLDIQNLQSQLAEKVQPSADRELSSSNISWQTVTSPPGQQTRRRYSQVVSRDPVTVPTANRFLPLGNSTAEATSIPNNPPGQERKPKKKPKVLFLADSNGRYCGEKLRDGLAKDFEVCTIFKPSAQVRQVVENVDQLTKDFGQEDFVIVHAGSNDLVLNVRETVSNVKEGMSKLKEVATRTKVVVNFIPARYDGFLVSQKVHKVNEVMEQAIGAQANIFINKQPEQMTRNLFARDGLHYNRLGKSKLCERLCVMVKAESQAVQHATMSPRASFSQTESFQQGCSSVFFRQGENVCQGK